jgi:hypothetical protein
MPLDHLPALPLGATYSWPSGADPAAASAANNAKMMDCDGDMFQTSRFDNRTIA